MDDSFKTMKLFLDTADTKLLHDGYLTGLIDGVTTNPTLMMKAGRNPVEVIKEISSLFLEDASISAEVVGDTAEEMVSQAKDYYSISKNITIKVPCSVEGLKACKVLSDKGVSVNVTLIFSVEQAILAAKAGATYVSPFVGRCEDNNIDGIGLLTFQAIGTRDYGIIMGFLVIGVLIRLFGIKFLNKIGKKLYNINKRNKKSSFK